MATTKKKPTSDLDILTLYMDQYLESSESVHNVYKFCKANKLDESEFYQYFSSLESIKSFFWQKIFENSLATIQKTEGYDEFSRQNKMLSFYFTCFENLTLNRSFAKETLPKSSSEFKNLKYLKEFKEHFLSFVDDNLSTQQAESDSSFNKLTKPITKESYWFQFLIILKFWFDDTSKGFEKTDIMIEKTVKAGTEIFDITPFEGLIDLGKFLWKEKFPKSKN